MHPHGQATGATEHDTGLNVSDLVFSAEFHQLLELLHSSGARRILVADLPPALGNTTPYNTAIHAEVTATHAELVSLANTAITVAPTDGLTPQPDAASHRLIAAPPSGR